MRVRPERRGEYTGVITRATPLWPIKARGPRDVRVSRSAVRYGRLSTSVIGRHSDVVAKVAKANSRINEATYTLSYGRSRAR